MFLVPRWSAGESFRWRERAERVSLKIAPGYSIIYVPGFFEPREANELLRSLLALDMSPEVIRMYGRDTVTKRRSEQYGAEYSYNPAAKRSKEWSPLMLAIRRRVECVAGRLDGGLVQVYPDGAAGIGWHRDKGKPEIIVSLSLGAERELAFGVEAARPCEEVRRLRLGHGSLLLIPAATNEAFKHRVPPARRITAPRVNVTLRRFR